MPVHGSRGEDPILACTRGKLQNSSVAIKLLVHHQASKAREIFSAVGHVVIRLVVREGGFPNDQLQR
jgi:hypothetical protein